MFVLPIWNCVCYIKKDWATDQPDISSEHCAVFYDGDDFLWHDVFCTYSYYPICKMYVLSVCIKEYARPNILLHKELLRHNI